LHDLVRSSDNLSITSTGGNITAEGVNALITAPTVNLTAGGDITANIESVKGNTGTLLTANAGGDVNLAVTQNQLRVNRVSGNNVTIHSGGDILQAGSGAAGIVTVKDAAGNGGNLILTSSGGRIGNVSGPVNGNVSPHELTSGQMFHFNVANNTKLEAIGQIDAYFDSFGNDNDRTRNPEGNLYVDQIVSAAGDVNLWVKGTIFDKNDFAQDDPNSDLFRSNLWNDLGLFDSIDEKHEKAIADLEKARTLEYFAAWQAIFDGYDTVTEEFRFSEEAKQSLVESGWTAEQIAIEEAERTKMYREAVAKVSKELLSTSIWKPTTLPLTR